MIRDHQQSKTNQLMSHIQCYVTHGLCSTKCTMMIWNLYWWSPF